jgi:hypothetical protein
LRDNEDAEHISTTLETLPMERPSEGLALDVDIIQIQTRVSNHEHQSEIQEGLKRKFYTMTDNDCKLFENMSKLSENDALLNTSVSQNTEDLTDMKNISQRSLVEQTDLSKNNCL